MPIWKFQDASSESVELEDMSLDLSAYRQALNDMLMYLRAHDGDESIDMLTYLIASSYSLNDIALALDVLYQSLENFGVDFSTFGTAYKDARTWLASYLLSLGDDISADFCTAKTSYEHLHTLLSVVATGYLHLKMYLYALGLSVTDMSAPLNSVGYNISNNLGAFLSATSKIIFKDLCIFLYASNGVVTENNIGLTLMAARRLSAPYAGTYQRLSSVSRRLS